VFMRNIAGRLITPQDEAAVQRGTEKARENEAAMAKYAGMSDTKKAKEIFEVMRGDEGFSVPLLDIKWWTDPKRASALEDMKVTHEKVQTAIDRGNVSKLKGLAMGVLNLSERKPKAVAKSKMAPLEGETTSRVLSTTPRKPKQYRAQDVPASLSPWAASQVRKQPAPALETVSEDESSEEEEEVESEAEIVQPPTPPPKKSKQRVKTSEKMKASHPGYAGPSARPSKNAPLGRTRSHAITGLKH